MTLVRMPEAQVIASMINNVISRLKRAAEDGEISAEDRDRVSEALHTALTLARKMRSLTGVEPVAPSVEVESTAPVVSPFPYGWSGI